MSSGDATGVSEDFLVRLPTVKYSQRELLIETLQDRELNDSSPDARRQLQELIMLVQNKSEPV